MNTRHTSRDIIRAAGALIRASAVQHKDRFRPHDTKVSASLESNSFEETNAQSHETNFTFSSPCLRHGPCCRRRSRDSRSYRGDGNSARRQRDGPRGPCHRQRSASSTPRHRGGTRRAAVIYAADAVATSSRVTQNPTRRQRGAIFVAAAPADAPAPATVVMTGGF